jgi:hypothetical protein
MLNSHDAESLRGRSEDFRAGVAYAAHMLRHAVGDAHDAHDVDLSRVEPRRCCQVAVTGMAIGMAEGLEEVAGQRARTHTHGEG